MPHGFIRRLGTGAAVKITHNETKCVVIIFVGLLAFIFIHCHTGNTDIAVYDNSPAETEYISGRLNLNTASAKELCSLMYMDEESAELIIDYRENNGGFKDVEDICNVKGLTLIRQKVIIDNCFVQDLGGN